jgi:hypothetical protein
MLYQFPSNPGYLLTQLTQSQLEPIWQEINQYPESHSDPTLHRSAAHRDLYLKDSHSYIEQLTAPLVNQYIEGFGYSEHLSRADVNRSLALSRTWVTFQKPGDFNPLHCHKGQLSFVIWLRIPYTFQQEQALPARSQLDQGSKHLNGDFQFQWTDSTGALRSHSIGADQQLEGSICLFAAALHHQVFPYYSSDKTRISVSGNWTFQ